MLTDHYNLLSGIIDSTAHTKEAVWSSQIDKYLQTTHYSTGSKQP